MSWNWGAYSKRSDSIERRDSPDISDDDLYRVLSSCDARSRWLGGHRIPLQFFSSISSLWPSGVPISILDVRCGLGGLSRAIIRWSRRHKLEFHITAIEKYARIVNMARESSREYPEIQFEPRTLNDAAFLQAQQFDYVVTDGGLRGEADSDLQHFLVTLNRLAKRGIVVTDFLRDIRGGFWMKNIARFSRNQNVLYDAELGVKKGFTHQEIKTLCDKAGLKFAVIKKNFGYRFSVEGERGLVLSGLPQSVPGLAGV